MLPRDARPEDFVSRDPSFCAIVLLIYLIRFELSLDILPDFTIVAGVNGQHVWPVHSNVLSRHSGYFKVLLESGFKVRLAYRPVEIVSLT